jgi:Chaperone of endosialidase
MKSSVTLKTTTSPFLLFFAFGYVAVCPLARGVLPAPDGGYLNFNTAEGQNALFSLTTGVANTAVGWFSLRNNTEGSFNTAVGAAALLSNVGDQSTGGGTQNTAVGTAALLNNINGSANTASGVLALFRNTEGSANTATGGNALFSNTLGGSNTATGFNALLSNTQGNFNTATGHEALEINTIGHNNTANGSRALADNSTGNLNTAIGAGALESNATGDNNTATGFAALNDNTSGDNNTATGNLALSANTGGNSNTANGFQALFNDINGSFNTADGFGALFNCTGTGNIGVGANAGANVTTASNTIVIGTAGSNVGNSCFIGNIRGVTTSISNAIPVVIDSAGQLGTMSSSRQYKKEVKPMDKASEAILALKPVTFHYKTDNTNTPQFGLIAEEVAKVNADLVVRDNKGLAYTVRYDAVNAMLLNEFLKEHKKVAEQAREIREQQAAINRLDEKVETAVALIEEYELKTSKVNEQDGANQSATKRVRRGGPIPRIVDNE